MIHVSRRTLLGWLAWTPAMSGSFAAPLLAQGPSVPNPVGLALQIKNIIDAFNWGLGAGEALSRGDPPPDQSKLTHEIIRRIDHVNDDIKKMDPPGFSAALPDTSGTVPNNLDALRSYLSSRESALQDAAFEYLEARDDYIGKLQDITDSVQELSDTQVAVAAALEKLIAVATFPIIADKLVHEWLSLSLNAGKSIGDCESTVSRKMRDAKTYFATRAAAIVAAGHGMINLLALEAAAVKGEADAIRQLETTLKAHQVSYAKAKAELDRLAFRVRTRKQDIINLQQQVASFDQEAQECITAAGNKQGELNAVLAWLRNWKSYFNDCPNHNSWDACDHMQIKKDWIDRVYSPKDRARINLSRDIGNLQQRARDLNQEKAQANRTIQDYQAKLAAEQSAYDGQSFTTASEKADLDTAQQSYDQRRFTSKADLFAAANSQSTAAVTALLARIQ